MRSFKLQASEFRQNLVYNNYKNIQNNLPQDRFISTLHNQKTLLLYDERYHIATLVPQQHQQMQNVQEHILQDYKWHNRNLKNLEWRYTKECWAEGISSPLDHNNRAAHMVDTVVAHTAQEHPVQRNRYIRYQIAALI